MVAGPNCAFIMLIFITVFLVLQIHLSFSFWRVKVYTGPSLISYKGFPSSEVWQEKCASDSEEDEGQGERTTFLIDHDHLLPTHPPPLSIF